MPESLTTGFVGNESASSRRSTAFRKDSTLGSFAIDQISLSQYRLPELLVNRLKVHHVDAAQCG